MRQILTIAAAVVLMTMSGTALAGNPNQTQRSSGTKHNTFTSPSHKPVKDYHLTSGTKFSHGYMYKGKNHFHWSSCYWNAEYGCYYYYDPCCLCYYYWSDLRGCYFPVTYITVVTPVATAITPAPAGIPVTQPVQGDMPTEAGPMVK